jgi:formamidopyrimidine-DNA glycosylase
MHPLGRQAKKKRTRKTTIEHEKRHAIARRVLRKPAFTRIVEAMPELAEVAYFCTQWNPGLGQRIDRVLLHPKARVFRGTDTARLTRALTGATLERSETRGKQMLFVAKGKGRTKSRGWLGVHLGMTGELRVEPVDYEPARHDHLVLHQARHALVFQDARQFGRILFHEGLTAPDWWADLPPDLLSPEFTVKALAEFLHRRARAPLKAVLLMQERFPGIGNWMADEILWRAALHPKQAAGSLEAKRIKTLYREIRTVCREALRVIGKDWSDPPDSWLFNHRWEKGGTCPRTGAKLQHATIGGRTTCWSPERQHLR